MRILVTGFEPFGGETINPSWEIVQRLQAPAASGGATPYELVRLLLPVDPQRVRGVLAEALQRTAPDQLLSLGQAGGRSHLSVERIGINVVTFTNPDGTPCEDLIEPLGPAAYFTTLDCRRLLATMQRRGVPALLSNTAGTYICNEVAYLAQHYSAGAGRALPAGFIHVPYLPQQAAGRPGVPSMALETMLAGVSAALEAMAGAAADLEARAPVAVTTH